PIVDMEPGGEIHGEVNIAEEGDEVALEYDFTDDEAEIDQGAVSSSMLVAPEYEFSDVEYYA
ncbi:hypothetical protein FRB90_004002, partial [Tulasnella sp. 427]